MTSIHYGNCIRQGLDYTVWDLLCHTAEMIKKTLFVDKDLTVFTFAGANACDYSLECKYPDRML